MATKTQTKTLDDQLMDIEPVTFSLGMGLASFGVAGDTTYHKVAWIAGMAIAIVEGMKVFNLVPKTHYYKELLKKNKLEVSEENLQYVRPSESQTLTSLFASVVPTLIAVEGSYQILSNNAGLLSPAEKGIAGAIGGLASAITSTYLLNRFSRTNVSELVHENYS